MTTLQRIQECIHEASGVPHADITPEARLVEDLGLDTLDLAEAILNLEDEFDILHIGGTDADSFRTVQDILTFIQEVRA
jgi:acyl carrier protein